jgi:hypothetical protein
LDLFERLRPGQNGGRFGAFDRYGIGVGTPTYMRSEQGQGLPG